MSVGFCHDLCLVFLLDAAVVSMLGCETCIPRTIEARLVRASRHGVLSGA